MKRLLISLIVLFPFLSFSKSSQVEFFNISEWNEGYVVMHTGDTVHCFLQFTRKVSEGLIQIIDGNQIKVLTVKDVRFFSYFDKRKNSDRRFYAMSFRPVLSNRTLEIFVEYVYGNDRVWLLNHKTMGFDARWHLNPFRKKNIVNNRYLLDQTTGMILPMSKENVLKIMENQKQAVLDYIHAKGMRLRNVDDFIALMDYHQTLL